MPADRMPGADMIIVGGGTAGCILAARLSEDPALQVVLIEAGPPDRNPLIHIPIGFSRLQHDPGVNWRYSTCPQNELDGRAIYWPRGRVLGGSSAINGMIWVRGDPEDFDSWARITGDDRWTWAAVQPVFAVIEAAAAGHDHRLGRNGRIPMAATSLRNPAVEAFLAAGEDSGLPRRTDLTISDRAGVGHYLVTTRNGVRVGSAGAYLKQAMRRRNLRVITGARVSRILLDAGNTARGVCITRGGQGTEIPARRGVVLASGTVNSPQILMLSGIGPGAELRRQGIPVLHDAPEVGRNLRDHFGVRVINRIGPRVTVNSDFARPWRLVRHALAYLLFRQGPLTMGGAHAGAFLSTRGQKRPDVQVNFLPLSVKGPGWDFHPFSAITANVCQLRPGSTGTIALASPDIHDAPVIDPNYLSDPDDRETLVAGLRRVREIFATPSFVQAMAPAEVAPGRDVRTDADLLNYARANGSTVYHPVGTCRMGADPAAVVTPDGRVNGACNLWVADASIMPTIPSGNTNAATALIAEKIAAGITGRAPWKERT